ncbi:SURF1 family protein [Maricaulis sp.]|uniref:SURF1 family protein n=1 Tax=Maricaulis sp. TaxID=1486257 RepID=UPI003A930E43
MPRFRPLPILTVFTLLSLVLLLSLGVWQLKRMEWKAELITAYGQRGAVTSFRQALCGDHDGAFGPRITAPAPLAGPQLRYYALRDQPGWVRVGLMPAPRCDADDPQRFLFVESGFEDLDGNLVSRPEAWRIELLPRPGSFVSGNDPDTNQWYNFDRDMMARALGTDPERVLDMWSRADLGLPVSLTQTPPAKHLGYAVTWFGLALALIGVYLALHIARGRLGRG